MIRLWLLGRSNKFLSQPRYLLKANYRSKQRQTRYLEACVTAKSSRISSLVIDISNEEKGLDTIHDRQMSYHMRVSTDEEWYILLRLECYQGHAAEVYQSDFGTTLARPWYWYPWYFPHDEAGHLLGAVPAQGIKRFPLLHTNLRTLHWTWRWIGIQLGCVSPCREMSLWTPREDIP